MNEDLFNENDLRHSKIQYVVRHTSSNMFKAGESVFLKSNPEVKLIVFDTSDKEVEVVHANDLACFEHMTFPPECLLQYRYAGLVELNKKYKICIN